MSFWEGFCSRKMTALFHYGVFMHKATASRRWPYEMQNKN